MLLDRKGVVARNSLTVKIMVKPDCRGSGRNTKLNYYSWAAGF